MQKLGQKSRELDGKMNLSLIEEDIKTIVTEVVSAANLSRDALLVIGCSTSEVLGGHIGKAGSSEVAEALFNGIVAIQEKWTFNLAFQSCEHINRALVIERKTQVQYGLETVTVIPSPHAGGPLATYAYHHFDEPVMVEHLRADAGIDIGDTFIGMHLKPVAVPVRPGIKTIGQAHVTAARTRPRYIGGPRATYPRNENTVI